MLYGTICHHWEMGTSFTELTTHTHTHTAYAHADPIYQGPDYRPTRLQSIVLTGSAGAAGYSVAELFIVFLSKKKQLRIKKAGPCM